MCITLKLCLMRVRRIHRPLLTWFNTMVLIFLVITLSAGSGLFCRRIYFYDSGVFLYQKVGDKFWQARCISVVALFVSKLCFIALFISLPQLVEINVLSPNFAGFLWNNHTIIMGYDADVSKIISDGKT